MGDRFELAGTSMDVHAQKKDTAARALVPMLIDSSAGSGSSMEEQKGINGDGHRDIVTSSKKGTYIFLTSGYNKRGK